MRKSQCSNESSQLLVHLHPVIGMTDDQFFEFCQINRELWIERTADGDLIIGPLKDCKTSRRNVEITTALAMWEKQNESGVAFGSATGFTLPNGAVFAPNAGWVRRSRLATLTREQKRKFLPLCPDFVIELRSPSDRLGDLQDKMQEYIDNGAQLGWLIDPGDKRVYVYRPDCEVECLENPSNISGEPVLAGFILDLGEIWEPDF